MRLIYLIVFLVLFNFPIKHLSGGISLYYYIVFYMIGIFFFRKIAYKEKISKKFNYVYVFILLYILLFILEFIFGVTTDGSGAVKSVVSLLWVYIFYLLLFNSDRNFNLSNFVKFQVYMAIIIAVIGYLQYFGSRDLWGFIPRIRGDGFYDDLDYAVRASSILYSAQVFGLYCVLYVVLLLEFRHLFKWYFVVVGFISLFLAGLLSGNKSVSVILVFYLFLKFCFSKRKLNNLAFFAISLFVLISFSIFTKYSDKIVNRSFAWVLDIDKVKSKESEGRFKVYSEFLERTNPVIGNGIGSTMPSNNDMYINTESYLLLIYSEGGVLLLGLYLIFVFSTLRRLYRLKSKSFFTLFACVVFSMIFVHAISSPAFFGIWGCIMFALRYNEDKMVKIENYESIN